MKFNQPKGKEAIINQKKDLTNNKQQQVLKYASSKFIPLTKGTNSSYW